MKKVPTFASYRKDNQLIFNFRKFGTGFDFIKYKSGSWFIQFGNKPVKYFCLINKKTDYSKEFFFLTRRTKRAWVPYLEFNFFGRRIEGGVTATPLPLTRHIHQVKNSKTDIRFNNGSRICLSSKKP